jgi:hypothetical protein
LRRGQLRRSRTAVLEAANKCGKGQTAVVIVEPPVTHADIRAAFDEIDEKLHLVGTRLHFDLEKDTVTAIFDPAGTPDKAWGSLQADDYVGSTRHLVPR